MKQVNALSVAVSLHTDAFIVKMQIGLTGSHWHSRPSSVAGGTAITRLRSAVRLDTANYRKMAFSVSNDWLSLTSIESDQGSFLTKGLVIPSSSV
jgi:hypothetical protein